MCQADPSEDLAAVASALRAEIVVRSSAGTRDRAGPRVPHGPYETVVEPAEILTEVRVPIRPGAGSAYEKVERRVGDWAVAAAGAFVTLDGDTVSDVGIGLTAVGAPHFCAPEAEDVLRGQPATEENLAAAGRGRRRGLQPVRRPARAGRLQAPPGRRADAAGAAALGGPGPRRRS